MEIRDFGGKPRSLLAAESSCRQTVSSYQCNSPVTWMQRNPGFRDLMSPSSRGALKEKCQFPVGPGPQDPPPCGFIVESERL